MMLTLTDFALFKRKREKYCYCRNFNNNLAQLSRAGATESGGNLHLSFDQLKNTFFQYEIDCKLAQ